ncbi:response regulator [Thalassotalea euphylliae]|uniref:response regulator n=1 Tax=Thalassotalea euphylliae TaxID=1655234 RepID=UPI0036253C5F
MTQQRILMVEDDEDLGQIMFQFLEASAFDTQWLKTGEDVVSTVRHAKPDLILMDVMIPVVDGVTLTKQIRTFSEVPIIMVTAKSDEVSRLIGLQTGVDDYVCKPFSAPELILRIKAILRRTAAINAQDAEPEIQKNQLQLDENKLVVKYLEKTEKVTFVEFSLLKLLTSNPNRIYNREQIISLVYETYRDISDRTVDSHIKNLRKKLVAIGADRASIESVYGVGYRFVEDDAA